MCTYLLRFQFNGLEFVWVESSGRGLAAGGELSVLLVKVCLGILVFVLKNDDEMLLHLYKR